MKFLGAGLPGIDARRITGRLIVLEGPDYVGRSTQADLLQSRLETDGHAVLPVGLGSSHLVGEAIAEAKRGNLLGRITMTLMYATDFADLLENQMIPALQAGFVVLADRYVHSMMARDLVRGGDLAWLEDLFSFALVPDTCLYLDAPPEVLVHRGFSKLGRLDYWESGMDLGLSSDMYTSFLEYHRRIRDEFLRCFTLMPAERVDACRTIEEVNDDLYHRVQDVLP